MSEPVVYFIEDSATGHIKIGHSIDVWKRLLYLQTACPGELSLLGVVPGDAAREAGIHARFAEHRLRGEWFERHEALDAFIAELPSVQRRRTSKSRAFWGGASDAELSRVVEISKVTLCDIRSGKRRPSPELALKLQRATGISAVALVFGEFADEAISGATIRPPMRDAA